jgi:hypothetical protein
MTVAPEVIVILLYSLPDLAQPIGGNDEVQVFLLHADYLS